MSQEGNLEKMERGRQATVALSLVEEYIKDAVNAKMINLVAAYRGQSITHDMIVGGIAEISALFAMQSEMETDKRVGELASEKEIGNA